MQIRYVFLIALFMFSCSEKPPKAVNQISGENRVIYGEDGRNEVESLPGGVLERVTRATVALFPKDRIHMLGDGSAKVSDSTMDDEWGLCEGERFSEQRGSAYCSGSLIAPDRILTAGHCITDEDGCADTYFVFDYKTNGHLTTGFMNASNIYSCKRVVKRELTHEESDWAVVELDRPVFDRAPIAVGNSDTLTEGHPITVVGHPSGLPMKVTTGGKVRKMTPSHFIANLDTYGGNSGSPIVSDLDGTQVGILVRGETDFTYDFDKDCTMSFHCEDDDCRGEDGVLVNLAKPYFDAPYDGKVDLIEQEDSFFPFSFGGGKTK